MLDGTEREVLERLFDRPRSPTEVAEDLGVSVQTASRNLKRLAERGYAERTDRGSGRGYKRYRAAEFAHLFAGYDGKLRERTLSLSEDKRAILSVWAVPQPEFHPVLTAYLFTTVKQFAEPEEIDVAAILVYGSVARGTAEPESDVDVLVVYDDMEDMDTVSNRPYLHGSGWLGFGEDRLVSEQWFSREEFHDGREAGSQFLRTVLDEGIVLYDPEGVIRDARRNRAGESIPQ